ncbi:MAG: transposase [Saprospiraceae bacterium]|nr:transposase [Saprospiraceae bacterium]
MHKNAEPLIYDFINIQFQDFGCPVNAINRKPEHIHVLFLLNPQKSLAEVIKQVKGSSSHIINQQDLTQEKFSWQTGYAAFSVSGSLVDTVSLYIQIQKEHHAKKSFQTEFDDLLKEHGLEMDS